jgi:multiple sugar transport system permease protein
LHHVQLPYLIPWITTILILRIADTLKLFDMVFAMTHGGPESSTEFASLMIRRIGFLDFDRGFGSSFDFIGRHHLAR